MKKKKSRLKRWVYVLIYTILISIIAIAIYQLFTIRTYYTTPYGTYTCNGKIIQVCSGSREVARNIGA